MLIKEMAHDTHIQDSKDIFYNFWSVLSVKW